MLCPGSLMNLVMGELPLTICFTFIIIISGLSQPDYFKFALSAMPATPSIVSANLGKTVSKADLIEAYGGDDFAVPQCESSKYLNQILNCVSIDTNTGAPQKLVKCPDVVVKEGDCGEEIQIATFKNFKIGGLTALVD